MNNDEIEQRIRTAFSSDDMEEFARLQLEMAADDIVQEWPQSGERIRGLDNIKAVGENYSASTGTSPKMTLRRILQPGKAWVIEGIIDYGDGVPVSAVSIIETDDLTYEPIPERLSDRELAVLLTALVRLEALIIIE